MSTQQVQPGTQNKFSGRVYDGTRMDTIWAFRQAYVWPNVAVDYLIEWFNRYNTAKKIKDQQDQYCSRALNFDWHKLGEFPEVFEWEALVDVLRGRVKVRRS